MTAKQQPKIKLKKSSHVLQKISTIIVVSIGSKHEKSFTPIIFCLYMKIGKNEVCLRNYSIALFKTKHDLFKKIWNDYSLKADRSQSVLNENHAWNCFLRCFTLSDFIFDHYF